MALPPSLSSSSGSFDGAMFARYMLEPNSEECTPPRITRFSFEDEDARDNISASFSGQFSSYYGLPYDCSPPPEENNQDTASEHSSRGPITPPAPGFPLLPLEISSPLSTSMKPLDDPFNQGSTSLILDPHSLPAGQSLLDDTPSYLGLAARSEDKSSRPSRAHPQTILTSTPISAPTRQTTPPPEELSQLTGSNRGVTVQQLALDIPMSRSRSGSLSTLIHALEDASPSWYQSLMDSALPNSGSQYSVSTVSIPPAETPRYPSRRGNKAMESSVSVGGLPMDMLADIARLEAVAIAVRRLPIPRPHTMALDVAATAFFAPSTAVPPLPSSRHISLQSPPLTPLEEEDERERQPTVRYAPTIQSQDEDRSSASSSASPRSTQDDSSYDMVDAGQLAFSNTPQYPKLAKTLGMRSSMPARSRFLAPAPKTPSWRAGRHSAIPRMPAQPAPRTRPPVLPQEDMKTPKKALQSQTPHKTPKPLNLHSLFRRRPSAPPLPMQPPDLSGSPLRGTAKRAAHLSEPVMRPPLQSSGDSTSGKSVKHYGTASETHWQLPPQSPLGSFLPM